MPTKLCRRLAWLCLLAPLGCVSRELEPAVSALPTATAKRVVTGGACLELGEAEKPALSAVAFVRRVRELVADERSESARRLIRRYPDLALETLRSTTNADAGDAALQLVAHIYDEQCGSAYAAESWFVLLQARAAHPDQYAAYEMARRQFLELIGAAKFHEATQALAGVSPTAGLLQIDVFHLLGEAYLQNERPAEAVAALTRAVESAHDSQPYQIVRILLLLGEAQRRSGGTALGAGTWQQAVLLAGSLLQRPVPIKDPLLWERASYLRPVQTSWPAPVVRLMVPVAQPAPAEPRTGLDEAWLWARIGSWHLDRRESQAALVAFKRAESLNLAQEFQEQMRLLEARALLQLDQRQAAMGLLTQLAGNATSPTAAPALALLGSCRLLDGSPGQTLALLKKAVEEGPDSDWSGRGQAEADLGLAYLMTGSEAEGLRWLHSGQRRFEAEHEHELLLLSLDNEARYFAHTKRAEEASRLRARVSMLEASAAPSN